MPVPSVKVNKFPKLPTSSWTNSTKLPSLAVCVKPLHFNFDKSVQLIEFIEMYRLQGASHFFFYNHSIGGNVSKILWHYRKQAMATILPWNLPVPSQQMVRTEAMFTAIADCILRSAY